MFRVLGQPHNINFHFALVYTLGVRHQFNYDLVIDDCRLVKYFKIRLEFKKS